MWFVGLRIRHSSPRSVRQEITSIKNKNQADLGKDQQKKSGGRLETASLWSSVNPSTLMGVAGEVIDKIVSDVRFATIGRRPCRAMRTEKNQSTITS